MATTTRVVTVPPELDPVAVFGPIDEVIRVVEQAFPELTILVRGNRVAIVSRSKQTEAQAAQAEEVMHTLIDEAYTAPMDADTVRRLLDRRVLRNGARSQRMDDVRKFGAAAAVPRNAMVESVGRIAQDRRRAHVPGVITFAAGVPVRPKTPGQIAYVNTIESNTITFAIGPAGTGKTYLAVAKAVRAFQDGEVRRIILTRPAVEAGENLGFLPGTLSEKVDPYLRPLYDALSDMLGAEQLHRLMDDGTIEVARIYARTYTQRRFRHPRRGSEHDRTADEDVPDTSGIQHQDDHYGRYHAGRFDRATFRPRNNRRHLAWHQRYRLRALGF